MTLSKITASLLTLTTVAASPVAALAQSGNQTRVSQCNQIIAIALRSGNGCESAYQQYRGILFRDDA
jgi:hypothetical protein